MLRWSNCFACCGEVRDGEDRQDENGDDCEVCDSEYDDLGIVSGCLPFLFPLFSF